MRSHFVTQAGVQWLNHRPGAQGTGAAQIHFLVKKGDATRRHVTVKRPQKGACGGGAAQPLGSGGRHWPGHGIGRYTPNTGPGESEHRGEA